tara:strand:- start:1473 stop:1721 length:249 start_codon:yes stop_codon:yes gene_type:complete
MNKQVNLRLPEKLLISAKRYSKKNGFTSVQEFIKETIREKLFKPEFTKKEIDLIAKFAQVCEEKNLFGTEEELNKKLHRYKK